MFEVGFRTTGKDELTKAIGPQITQIANEINKAFSAPAGKGLKSEIVAATREANILQNALKKATSDKGISFVSLNSELRKAGTSAEQMVRTLGKAGPAFSQSFNVALTALATADRRVITISEKIKEMQRVMTQSIKFTAAQGIQRQVMSAMAQSIGWVKDLNRALTEISVVTGKTGDDLDKVYESAVRGSKQLRVAADEYAKGALIFYQQGLNDTEVQRRTEITIKAAKAANQSIQEMSSQLTSIWNNYRMIGEEQERAASVGAALAAKTAVDFKDIATAMQTAAAPAAQMGVEYNQLAAIIATVGDVSQQSASTIGNAYKTIFSRFQQLKSEGTDGQVTLSSVSSQLKGLGINVLDQAGNLRELGTVINEVGMNWNNWTQTQQTAIAQIVGGTRQYGQFLTLMQNFDKYQKNLQIANAEDGSELEGQYGRALESIESKAENAGEAWKRAFGGVFDEDLIKKFYEVIEEVGNAVDGVFGAFDDWKGILTVIIALVAKSLVPSLLNGAKTLKDTFNNLTPKKREENRKNEANQTRDQAFRNVLKSTSGDANKTITDGLKELQGKGADDRANGYKQLQQQLAGQKGISKELQRQIALQMQKADIQENIGNMASKIEELEAIGTREAQAKAEMLRAQVESYSAAMLSLADQTAEIQRQNELYSGTLQGRENSVDPSTLISDELSDLDLEINETTAAIERMKEEYDSMWNSGTSTDSDIYLKINEISEAEGKLKDLTETQKKMIQRMKEQAADTDIGRDVIKIGNAIGENLMDIIDEGTDAGKKLMDKIVEGLGDDSGRLGDALKTAFEGLNGTDIGFDDISQALNEALASAFAGEEGGVPAEIQSRINQINEMIRTGGQVNAQGSNIWSSIDEEVQQFSTGLDGAITAATNLAAAATLAATGIKAMGKAMEEGDPIAFAAGLGTAATGVVQFVSALPQAKAGFIGLGKSLTSMGTKIASVVPGLGGIASAASATTASLGAMAAAAAVAVAAIAAVVAVVAALVFAWQEYQNSKPEAKLERAEAAAQELVKAEEDAKAAAQELLDTFEDYKSAEEALEGCKRGTEEWEQALRKVNEAALTVVDALPDDINVSDAYSRDSDGRIRLNEDTIKQGQDILDDKAFVASYTASSAKVQAQMARNDLDAANIGKTIANAQMHWNETGEYQTSDQSSQQIAQILTESAEKFKDLATNDVEGFKKALEEAGISVEHLTDQEIQGFAQQINDLGNATEAAREKMDLVAKIAVDEKLAGTGYSNDVKDVTGERIAAKTKDLTDEYLGALTNGEEGSDKNAQKYGDIAKGDTRIDDELLAEYNKLTGNNYASSGNGVQGTDTNRIFEFITEEGETIQLSAKQMAEQMAAAAALLDVEGAAADIANDFAKLDKIIEDPTQQGEAGSDNAGAIQAQGLKDFLTNKNMNSLTDDELAAMAGLDNDQIASMVKDMFGFDDAQLEEWVKGYGYDTVDAFTQGLKEGVESSQTASEHAADNLTSSTKKMFDQVAGDGNLTVAAKEALAQSLVQAFDNFDRETAQKFTDAVDAMGDDADKFLSNINDIDWDTASPEELREQFQKLGIQSNLTDDQLEDLIAAMRGVGDASVDAAQSYVKNLNEASSGIDENNSIISDEDYKKLEEAGINVKAFFQDMGDGTHQLTADADAFKQMVHDIGMGKLQEAKQNSIDSMGRLDRAKSWVDNVNNWEEGSTSQTGAMAYALQNSGQVSNSQFEEWRDKDWTKDAEVAAEIRQAYADAGLSAEKIDQMMTEAAAEAKRAQEAMDNADFAFEVESAGLDLEETTRYANRLKSAMLEGKDASKMSEKEMRLYSQAAKDAAIANQKLDRGIGNLKKNLKDYKKALKDNNRESAEWSKAMNSLKTDLADIVGFDDADLLSDEFAESALNGDLLKSAMEGDVEAIRSLQAAAANDMILNLQFNNGLDETQFSAVQSNWESLQTMLANGLHAEGVDQTKLQESFNAMIKNGKMTKDQIEAALAGLHVSANVVTTYHKSTEQVPIQTTEEWWDRDSGKDKTVNVYDDDGNVVDTYVKPAYIKHTKSYTSGYEEAEVMMPSYEIEGTKEDGSNGTIFADAPAPTPSKGGTSFSGNPSSGGSKGGGGGSSKTVKPKDKPTKKDDSFKTRYKTLENYAEEYNTIVQHLNSSLDDAWGPKRLEQMRKYQQALLNSAKIQTALIKKVKEWHKYDKAEFLKTDLGKQAQFTGGEFSDIANVQQLYDILDSQTKLAEAARDKAYDDAARLYGGTTNQEAYDAAIEAADNMYDKTTEGLKEQQELMEQFLETHDKLREEIEKQIDAIRTYVQVRIDEIKFDLEFKLRIPERDLKRLERLVDRIGDIGIIKGDTFSALTDVFSSIGEQVKATEDAGYDLIKFLSELNPDDAESKKKFIDAYGEEAWKEYIKDTSAVPAAIMDNFEELIDQMYDYLEDVYDNSSEIFDAMIREVEIFFEQFDAISDKLETQISRLDMLDSLIDISPSAQTKKGRDMKAKTRQTRADNAWTQANLADSRYENSKEYYKALDNQYKDLETELAGIDEADLENRKRVQFEMEKVASARKDAYDEMTANEQDRNDKISEAAQIMRENLEAEFDDITADFEEGLNGMFSTLDDAISMFQQKAELRDWYLDDFEKGFAFDDINDKIQDAIDETADPKKLEALQKFQQRMNELKESGKQITQEEMNIENKRLEILLLEQSIEEQNQENAKNTMRLQRDSSGNYAYVYSGDQKDEEDKLDQLRQLKAELYDMEKQAMRATDQMYYEAYQELEGYIRAKNEALRQGDVQYAQMMEEKIRMAEEKLERIVSDNERLTSMMASDFGQMATETNGSITAIIGGYTDLRTQHEDYKVKAQDYDQQLIDAADKMQKETTSRLEELGIDYENLEKVVWNETDQMMKENENLRLKIKELKDNAATYFTQFEQRISSWREKTNAEIQAVIDKINALKAAMEAQKKANEEGAQKYTEEQPQESPQAPTPQLPDPGESGKQDYKTLDGETANKIAATIIRNAGKSGWNNGQIRYGHLDEVFGPGSAQQVQGIINGWYTGKKTSSGLGIYNVPSQYVEAAISGNYYYEAMKNAYTGGLFTAPDITTIAEKGPELVLNAEDTENILKAVSMVREFVAKSMAIKSYGLESQLAEYQRLHNDFQIAQESQQLYDKLDQQVRIEASFPGVSVAAEIEEALNSLITQAAQYNIKQ